ncbi:unnamed protein product [Gemmata massiliana]|uniref:Uncharacterized protein n=1 Tax=Gemmata massiliana TaxID=1210884 RepID=A0A6P2D2D2_9BACT|nr:unnamed protein product [Gemmata massiliana]
MINAVADRATIRIVSHRKNNSFQISIDFKNKFTYPTSPTIEFVTAEPGRDPRPTRAQNAGTGLGARRPRGGTTSGDGERGGHRPVVRSGLGRTIHERRGGTRPRSRYTCSSQYDLAHDTRTDLSGPSPIGPGASHQIAPRPARPHPANCATPRHPRRTAPRRGVRPQVMCEHPRSGTRGRRSERKGDFVQGPGVRATQLGVCRYGGGAHGRCLAHPTGRAIAEGGGA